MSALIGLSTGRSIPIIVDYVDEQSAELVGYVPTMSPTLIEAIDEVRIPVADVAWASAFIEEIDASFEDFWGYTNYQAGSCLGLAKRRGYRVTRRSEREPDFSTFPTRFRPPRKRCVELRTSIPLYFDFNWLDHLRQLNQIIDAPGTTKGPTPQSRADGTALLSSRGVVTLVEPAAVYQIEGTSWELASIASPIHDLAEPLALLFRRDRFIYPRELWCTLRNEISVCGELIPFQVEGHERSVSTALKVRGAAFRANDGLPAFPFNGSMKDYLAARVLQIFGGTPVFARTTLETFPSNEDVLETARAWMVKALDDFGCHVFPTITEGIRDAGVDILLEFPVSQCRLGFQIKGPRELSASGAETVEGAIKRQIQESRQYALHRLFILMLPAPGEKRALDRVRSIIGSLARMNDDYVIIVPPETLIA